MFQNVCVFKHIVFSKDACFLLPENAVKNQKLQSEQLLHKNAPTPDNEVKNQNYSLNSCCVKMFVSRFCIRDLV